MRDAHRPLFADASSASGTTTYVYGLSLISKTDASGATSYFLPDGLGSTAQLTDTSGSVTDSYSHDVFGALRSQTGTTANDFRYTGQQHDYNAAGGLYYLRARAYDPALGRFLQQDEISLLQSYSYAGDNPLNYSDPAGLCKKSANPFEIIRACANDAKDVGGTAWNAAVNYVGGAEVAGLYQLGKATAWVLRTDCGNVALDLATYAAYVPNPYAQAVGYTAITLQFVLNAPPDAKERDWFGAGLSAGGFISAVGEHLATTEVQQRLIGGAGISLSVTGTSRAVGKCLG